jgi:hypothetical protein
MFQYIKQKLQKLFTVNTDFKKIKEPNLKEEFDIIEFNKRFVAYKKKHNINKVYYKSYNISYLF